MRAVIYKEFGEPANVLKCEEKASVEPGKGEVRVRMLYSPINPSDLMSIRGGYGIQPELPATPGFEGVGVVEASGGGLLGSLIKGKRVVVLNRQTGNWSEETIVPAKQAIPIPNDLSLEQAAMFFVNPATSYVMTQEVLKIPRGEWLLQTAAGSALGRMIIRLGKLYGFKTLNVVRRKEQIAELKELGADEVLCYDGTTEKKEEFLKQVALCTGKKPLRYAIDPVGGMTGTAAAEALSKNGRLLVYGSLSGKSVEISPRSLVTYNIRVEGFWLSRHMAELNLIGKIKLVKKITQLMRQDVLQAGVGKVYEMEQIADAVTEAEAMGKAGKILLKIAKES